MYKPMLVFLLLCGAAASSAAPVCSARSPAQRVALVELYTSEGCSSCPPADRYLATLAGSGAVLLSMHVDYWNRLGWRDPFARPEAGARQRWLADLAGGRTIYTPELFVGGRELRGGPAEWRARLPDALARTGALPAGAGITLLLDALPGPDQAVEARVAAPRGGRLHLALVENGIDVRVSAGENGGRTLHHEFVVRAWLDPVVLEPGTTTVRRVLPVPPGARPDRMAVAAFVDTEQGEVLQALSLPLCGTAGS
jgi:hypothetical protein